MSGGHYKPRKALATKQEQLHLQQPEATVDKSHVKSSTKATGGSFLARIKAAPPLVVADDSSDEEPPTEHDEEDLPAAATIISSLPEQPAGRPSPSVAQSTAARPDQSASPGLSLSAAPRSASPRRFSHAGPAAPLDYSLSHATAATGPPLLQQPSSDSDALSYVDIDSEYVVEAARPSHVLRIGSFPTDGGQLSRRRKTGAKKGPWWSAEGLSPQKNSSVSRSIARGKDAPFTFYEDASRPTVYGQPARRTPPLSHPPVSRPQPQPRLSPLRLEQQQEAQRPPRRTPKKSLLSNDEVTRALDPEALLASFRTADEAIRARPRARRQENAVSVVHEEVEDEENQNLSEVGEEDLPDPVKLKQQTTSAAGNKHEHGRKGRGTAVMEDTSPRIIFDTKRKPRRQEQPASDSQPDEFDTPPHLAASSHPRRQTLTSTTPPHANRFIDLTAAPSSEIEVEEGPAKGKLKSGKGKAAAKGKGEGKVARKKESPPVDTQALLAMLPRRKRRIEIELTDSGEEPEDEEDEVDSDVDEIGYRAKKKRSSSSKAKASTSFMAKSLNSSKMKKPKKSGRGQKADVEEEDEKEPDSGKERAKQKRLAQLKETDDYSLEIMTVL